MANDTSPSLSTRPRHRSEVYNNAGACAVSLLQLIGAVFIIALGVVAYVIEGELKYYGVPIWFGSLFFLTSITGFISMKKTICGIRTFLVTCMLTTAAASGLLVLFAHVLSQGSRYYECDTQDPATLKCMHYTSNQTLLIVDACTLGLYALEFTTAAVGIGLCMCGLCRRQMGRTSAAPTPAPTPMSHSGPPHTHIVTTTDASAMQLNFFTHEVAIPSAPPEYVVAEEEMGR